MRIFKLFKKPLKINNLVLKKNNNTVFKKRFLNKISLNSSLSQVDSFLFTSEYKNVNLFTSNLLDIKTDLYKSLKYLKILKHQGFSSHLNSDLDSFCVKLQSSKLFSSSIELQKKENRKEVICFLKKLWWKKMLCSSKNFEKVYFLKILKDIREKKLKKQSLVNKKRIKKIKIKKKNLKRLIKKGYNFFSNDLRYVSNSKWASFLSLLKNRQFSSRLMGPRFFFLKNEKNFVSDTKKKYKTSPKILRKKLQRLSFFFNIYHLSFLKYKKKKHSSYRFLKSLLWRRKKQRRRLKSKLFRVRSIRRAHRYRRRLLYKFYIPKHMEINFKTLSFVSHSSPDIQTLSSKIPFRLNIRRLLTFMAF